MMREYLSLIRVKSYIKNVLIFAPSFFAGSLSFDNLKVLFLGFLAFSLTASLIYIINDILDVENDKIHPVKKHRPLASGKISVYNAKLVAVLLTVFIFVLAVFIENFGFFLSLVLYFLINLAYSLYVKNIPLLDLIFLSFSYVLRLVAGSLIVGVYLSPWIVLVSIGLSILLGAGKRIEDVILLENSGSITRKVAKYYSVEFLKTVIIFSSFYVVFLYTIYTIYVYPNSMLYLTSFIVFLGFLRYFQIVFQNKEYYDPTTIILKDNILKLIILFWLIVFIFLKDFRFNF